MFSFFSKSIPKSSNEQLEIIPATVANPYFSNQTITPKFILLHCTGYHDPQEVWLKNQVSTHYLIPEQNNTNTNIENLIAYEVVKVPLKARHAGVSSWQNITGLNSHAIGIEINMPNYARALMNDTLDFKYFEPYQHAQIRALILLVQALQKNYSIPAENIIGHSDVAPWRQQEHQTLLGKTDPGPTLPWKNLSELGISRWFDQNLECPDLVSQSLSAKIAQTYLEKIGYAIEHTNTFDLKTNLTLGSYRLHFMPDCFDAQTGYADDCYAQPFDASTACTMYRILETSPNEPNSDSAKSALMWAGLGVASGGTLLLAYLAVSYLAKRCNRKSANNDEAYNEFNEQTNQSRLSP
jgi:N-acetylmuramoyl-L-alanine amidase